MLPPGAIDNSFLLNSIEVGVVGVELSAVTLIEWMYKVFVTQLTVNLILPSNDVDPVLLMVALLGVAPPLFVRATVPKVLLPIVTEIFPAPLVVVVEYLNSIELTTFLR